MGGCRGNENSESQGISREYLTSMESEKLGQNAYKKTMGENMKKYRISIYIYNI